MLPWTPVLCSVQPSPQMLSPVSHHTPSFRVTRGLPLSAWQKVQRHRRKTFSSGAPGWSCCLHQFNVPTNETTVSCSHFCTRAQEPHRLCTAGYQQEHLNRPPASRSSAGGDALQVETLLRVLRCWPALFKLKTQMKRVRRGRKVKQSPVNSGDGGESAGDTQL